MCLLYRLLCWLVRVLVRGGRERELEIIVLRHQLKILRRGGRRPRYTSTDRALLAAASRLLPSERWVVLCGQPADAAPLAPGAATRRSAPAVSQARSSPACR
jgi:hypothetical protein